MIMKDDLNAVCTEELLHTAFEKCEGREAADQIMCRPYSDGSQRDLEDGTFPYVYRVWQKNKSKMKMNHGPIYGSFGYHRYYIAQDGTLLFHRGFKRYGFKLKQAEEAGFKLFGG